jgi:predicted nuclease of predicted toxin-antitoxin system
VKLLLDACMDGRNLAALAAAGHDVEAVAQWNPAAKDTEVLGHAFETGSILITLDKDFGELIVARGLPHCGLIRLVGFTGAEEAEACIAVLRRFESELQGGAIVTFEPDRHRIRLN